MVNFERIKNELNLYEDGKEDESGKETGKNREKIEKKINKIFENEKCKIFSEDKEDTTIETIDYNDKLRILGFLMKDIQGDDIGYASFSSAEEERAYISVNYLKTKYITEMQKDFSESTKKSLNNENFEILAAIKIYSEFKGKGYGKILFEHAMEYLSKKGFKELYVSSDVTAMDNHGEKSFYEKIGDSTKREGADVIIDLEKWYENYLKNKQE